MKPAHRHAELIVLLNAIQDLTSVLARDLKTGYDLGYDGRSGASEVKIRSGGSDPTLTTIESESREAIRLAVRRAGRVIDRTKSDLAEAHSGLFDAMKMVDPRQTPPLTLKDYIHSTKTEVKVPQEFQARRMSRGEP